MLQLMRVSEAKIQSSEPLNLVSIKLLDPNKIPLQQIAEKYHVPLKKEIILRNIN